MSNTFFRFKQFTVWHDRCAMKVGTDGVLLGAWCFSSPLNYSSFAASCSEASSKLSILDIGTGSGLIALMLAQRFPTAHIDAIDIAPEAIDQSQYNFSLSPWPNRLHAHLCSLQDWSRIKSSIIHTAKQILPFRAKNHQSSIAYDLIVSNPPYFINSLKNPDHGRELARHTDTLSYADLLQHSARLLSDNGTLALILPANEEVNIIAKAANYGLYPTRMTRVFSKPDKPTHIRILIEFQKQVSLQKQVSPVRGDLEGSCFYLESPTSPRSPEYQNLTKDFYL